jgi:hypothetical protein
MLLSADGLYDCSEGRAYITNFGAQVFPVTTKKMQRHTIMQIIRGRPEKSKQQPPHGGVWRIYLIILLVIYGTGGADQIKEKFIICTVDARSKSGIRVTYLTGTSVTMIIK